MRAQHAGLLFGAMCGSSLSLGCIDEVHDQEVQALGPEQPGVPRGPLHRPGQPCVTCHGGSGPASTQFSVGGTLYAIQGQPQPAIGANVEVQDIVGDQWTGQSNAAGNFYALASDYRPHFPTQMTVIAAGADPTQAIQMNTVASREGSCADCHKNPQGQNSPGPVYVSLANGSP
jgi:hypothetical protein